MVTFAKGDRVRIKNSKDAALLGLSADETYVIGAVQDFDPNGWYRSQVAGHYQVVFLDGVCHPDNGVARACSGDPEGRVAFSGSWFEKVLGSSV